MGAMRGIRKMSQFQVHYSLSEFSLVRKYTLNFSLDSLFHLVLTHIWASILVPAGGEDGQGDFEAQFCYSGSELTLTACLLHNADFYFPPFII